MTTKPRPPLTPADRMARVAEATDIPPRAAERQPGCDGDRAAPPAPPMPGSQPAPGLVGMGFDTTVHPRHLDYDQQANGITAEAFRHPYLVDGHQSDSPQNVGNQRWRPVPVDYPNPR